MQEDEAGNLGPKLAKTALLLTKIVNISTLGLWRVSAPQILKDIAKSGNGGLLVRFDNNFAF